MWRFRFLGQLGIGPIILAVASVAAARRRVRAWEAAQR